MPESIPLHANTSIPGARDVALTKETADRHTGDSRRPSEERFHGKNHLEADTDARVDTERSERAQGTETGHPQACRQSGSKLKVGATIADDSPPVVLTEVETFNQEPSSSCKRIGDTAVSPATHVVAMSSKAKDGEKFDSVDLSGSEIESAKMAPERNDTHLGQNGGYKGQMSAAEEVKVDLNGDTGDKPKNINGHLQLQTPTPAKYRTSDGQEEEEDEEEEKRSGCCGRKKTRPPAVPAVGTFELFRFATKIDWLLMALGTLGAMVAGCAIPVNMVIYGQVINLFVFAAMGSNSTVVNGTNPAYADLFERISPYALYFCVIGVCSLLANYFAISLWCWTAERQGRCMRKFYFRAVMRQDMGWYDTHETGELNSRFSEDMHNIQEGLGDKMAVLLQWVTTWIAAYVMALSQGWKLALATISFSPVIMVAGAVTMRFIRNTAAQELQAYAKAGAVAEESLRAIRTVHAFHGQEKEVQRYMNNLKYAKQLATKKGLFLGLGTCSFWVIIFFTFALALWYGVRLVQLENMPPGNILPIFFGVLIGSMSLGHAFPNLEIMATARGAAAKVFSIIDHVPTIDISSPHGKVIKELQGYVDFQDVHFRYPARPDVKVLQGVSFSVKPKLTVALVGPSGCGKSTLIQLLQRFYDPHQGQVLVDGHDVRELHLGTLRGHLGVVSQEPVLFATSIAENIRFGRNDATQAQIEEVARAANCHDFISSLPQGYETIIGERGAQLSGGQKQRIAIARALVRNPKILLLDEATSALDTESETLVQQALERAGEGRTTIVIAHRLSTIHNADVIVCLSEGEVMETGNHDSLMKQQGLYYQLVKLQSHVTKNTKEDLEEVEIVEDDGENLEEEGEVLAKASFQRPDSARSLVARTSFRRRSARMSARGQKVKDKKMAKDKSDDVPPASLKRLLRMNSPEWFFILIGCIASVFGGCVHPAFSFILSEFIRVFALNDREEQSHLTMVLCLVMVGIGLGIAIIKLVQNYCFAKSGTYLTARMRGEAFRSIIGQDMEFFDDSKNQVSILTSRLASDAALVQGAAGVKIGNVLESMATLVCAIIIAFVYGWKLTLVVLCFMPIMIVAGIVQGKVMTGYAKTDKENVKNAGKISSEAIDNMRTLAALNQEQTFIDRFEVALDSIFRNGRKRAQLFGVTYGMAQCIIFFAYATAFVYGSYLVQIGEMEFFEVFRVFSAIIFGGMSVGRNSSFTPDYTKGKMAAGRLFAIIERKPKISSASDKGMKLEGFSGRLSMNEVAFSYPSRPGVRVLGHFSLDVFPGQTLALVGSSGGGKSTVVQLLERFYDPEAGSVTADSQDLRDIHLAWMRSQIGLVSQEPSLFDCSIAENIAYGDNSRVVSMDEIIAAARSANIHEFVAALPQGYSTNVGDKGTQMSGGQKQRIAIARALVRNPKILLLDEATSALDSESERVVQDALDKARQGRTCVVIAHRLSTIKSADRIAVMQQGQVAELGSHEELVAKKGVYYRLIQAQSQHRDSVS